MQRSPGNRLECLLQLQQSEFGWHEPENNRAVAYLCAQASHGRGQNTAMIMQHGIARHNAPLRREDTPLARRCRGRRGWRHPATLLGFRYQACLEQQLVPLQDKLFVPNGVVTAEGIVHALSARTTGGKVFALSGPTSQHRHDKARHDGGTSGAPIFPGEISIPVLPPDLITLTDRRYGLSLVGWLTCAGWLTFARQPQVADRYDALPCPIGAVTVSKRVELLYISQGMMCLRFDPCSQPGLQRAV